MKKLKSSIADNINRAFGEIKIDSYNSLTIGKNIDFSHCYNTH